MKLMESLNKLLTGLRNFIARRIHKNMNEIFKKLDIHGSKIITITRRRAITRGKPKPFEEQYSFDLFDSQSK